jgi:hypothetical protein
MGRVLLPGCTHQPIRQSMIRQLCSRCEDAGSYRTLSTNYHNLWLLRKAPTKQLASLYACASNDCTAFPIARAIVLLNELDVFEAVRVDDEGTKTSRAAPATVNLYALHFSIAELT